MKSSTTIPFYLTPWACFFLLVAANTLLSYISLTLTAKLEVGLFGLILPVLLAALSIHSWPVSENFLRKEFLPPVSIWVWVLIGIAVVFVRFYMLTTLSVWPNYDEGLWGFFALDFYHHWDLSLFYQDNSYPSVYFWGLGLLFKWFQPSVFLVWFYPALISLLVVPTGYGAARLFFSKSLSLFLGLFLAFSFWPIYVGRYGDQMVLTLWAECLLLWTWGRFLKSSSHPARIAVPETIALGVMSVLGLYIYISGVAIAFLSFLALGTFVWKQPHRRVYLGIFLVSSLLALIPLWQAGLIHNYGRITHDIGSLTGDGAFQNCLANIPGYISALFWGTPKGIYSYQPVWGGFLNPLLGSLFFLGLIQLLRTWKSPFSRWILAGCMLFFIPGILTHDLEPFRNLPLIPFLGVICAVGFLVLFQSLSPRKCMWGLCLMTLTFGGLDFYHLTNRYHHIWDANSAWTGYAKSQERFRAFHVLDKIRREKGPGLIYTDFAPGLCDQTLSVADHAFNAAQNPDLSTTSAQWAAVMVNANYKPFLARRFPDGKAYYLSYELAAPDGGQMLWVIPVTPDKKQALSMWQTASLSFCCFPGRYVEILRNNLMKAYSFYRGDPFLESLFWEKMADLDFKTSNFKDTQRPMEDLENALNLGYRAAHLYQRLAVFHIVRSEISQARESLKKAASSPINLTQSRDLLEQLENTSPPSRWMNEKERTFLFPKAIEWPLEFSQGG